MEDQLKTSPDANFTGKTYNKHPQWYNQPLRLTKEQKQHPILILEDFFEHYHLNEVREILWTWLTDAITSSSGIVNDSNERKNQIFFYEKIEALIEASFVIRNSAAKKQRKKLRKNKRS